MDIKAEITQLVKDFISSGDNFLVEVKVNPGKITVIIDHPKGVQIKDCMDINRYLHQKLDETDTFDKHELEVGSPGMEEPLKILPQYKKRIGQNVSVLMTDGIKRKGTLVNVDEEGLEINEDLNTGSGKKKEIQKQLSRILFQDIKETRLIISFDKII